MKPALLALALAFPMTLLAQGAVKPMWIQNLPQQSGRIYAMGLAVFAPSEAQAVKQAQVNARTEVLLRLRASVKSQTDIKSTAAVQRQTGGPTTGSSSSRVAQDNSIKTSAVDLPGLVVEENWSDQAGRTAYALAYLDVALAEQELRNRFNALKTDLAQENSAGGPRERLRALQRLKKAQDELTRLDDMASLLAAGGGDAGLRGEVRQQKLAMDRDLDTLRGSLTFSIAGDKDMGVGADITTIVRNAVLKQGLGWAEQGGEFTLQLRYQGARQGWDIQKRRWWEYQYNADFIVARGVLEITLTDKGGTQYESTTIEAKGVGTGEFQADQNLNKEYRKKMEATLTQWLANLVR